MACRSLLLLVPLALGCATEPPPVAAPEADPDPVSLFPSHEEVRSAEDRRLSRDLERALARLDGVADARAHVMRADPSLLSRDRERPSSAAVLITRGPGAAPDEAQIRELAAAAVPGLEPQGVRVFMSGEGAPEEIVSVGPLRVASSSAGTARAVLGGLLGVCVVLAAGLIWAGVKLRHRRRG